MYTVSGNLKLKNGDELFDLWLVWYEYIEVLSMVGTFPLLDKLVLHQRIAINAVFVKHGCECNFTSVFLIWKARNPFLYPDIFVKK